MKSTRALFACTIAHFLIAGCAWAAEPGKMTEACAGCHGPNGANPDASVPNIGGYSKTYLLSTLEGFAAQKRPCPEVTYASGSKKGTKSDMCQIAKALDKADADQIADFLAAQPFVRTAQKFDPAQAEKGKAIFAKSCTKCHSFEGDISNDDAGILPGQKTEYIQRQIAEFAAGTRPISKNMKTRFEKLNKAELEEIVQYLASFK